MNPAGAGRRAGGGQGATRADSAVIVNPIINSPFAEPQRHFRFDDGGITNEIVEGRRSSSYFIPIAQPKKKGKEQQRTFSDWTADRIEENRTVNFIRQRVKLWREGGHPDVTRTTARLLHHWKSPDRHRRSPRPGRCRRRP